MEMNTKIVLNQQILQISEIFFWYQLTKFLYKIKTLKFLPKILIIQLIRIFFNIHTTEGGNLPTEAIYKLIKSPFFLNF